jgi:zinc protease
MSRIAVLLLGMLLVSSAGAAGPVVLTQAQEVKGSMAQCPAAASGDGDVLTAFADGVDARVTEFTLKNGLQVIVYVDSSSPVVSTNVYYRVGFYYDPTGLSGISHMLEHMTFQRSDRYKPGELFRMVKRAGGFNNGFTSSLYTGYYETFARDRWELAMQIEASRMGKCVIADSDFASEHQVVAEETRLGENHPQGAFWTQFQAVALLANPQRNGLWPDDCTRFTSTNIRERYEQYYNPANAVLVVAGDVRPDEVRAKAEQYFGKLKGTPVSLPDYYNLEPKQSGQRRVIVRRRVFTPSLAMGWHIPGIRDSGYQAGPVAGAILAGGRSSRLWRALVTESGLATAVWGNGWVERDPTLLTLYVAPRAESLIPRIEEVVEREIRRLQDEPISDRELEQVHNQTLAGKIATRDDVSDMAFFLAHFQITTGSWRGFKDELMEIDRVTKGQIQNFCRTYLVPDNRTVGMLVAEREERK